MQKYIATKVEKLAADRVSNLTWTVNPNDVFYVSESGLLFLNREAITDIELRALKEEVKYIKKGRLFSILNETIRQKAIDKAMNKSISFEEVIAGKMMLHNLGIINSVIERIDLAKLPERKTPTS